VSIIIRHEVFRTRRDGEKLPTDLIRHTRVVGDLIYVERVPGYRPYRGIWSAMLMSEDGETYAIPMMDRCEMVKIWNNCTLIRGREVIPRGRGMKNIKSDTYPQAWYCRPVAISRNAFEGEQTFETPAEVRRKARDRELEETLEARAIAETLTRQSNRRMPLPRS